MTVKVLLAGWVALSGLAFMAWVLLTELGYYLERRRNRRRKARRRGYLTNFGRTR